MNIYQIVDGFYSGASKEIGAADGCPVGWTRLPPPILQGTEVAQWTGEGWLMRQHKPLPATSSFDRSVAALQIDDAVAAIYGRFTRFATEYQERETQAQAFQDAGYEGDVPPRVSEFATPAGMPAQAAADLILSQAVSLRAAQVALSALRMRKYEVLRAATDAEAAAVAAEILAGIAAVGAQVS